MAEPRGTDASRIPWGWFGDRAASRALCERALDRARGGGAAYADARLVEIQEERLYLRLDGELDQRTEHTAGIGVRVLYGGAWGFGARPLGEAAAAEETAPHETRMVSRADGVGDRLVSSP